MQCKNKPGGEKGKESAGLIVNIMFLFSFLMALKKEKVGCCQFQV